MCRGNMVPVPDDSHYLTTLVIKDLDTSIKSQGWTNNHFCFHNQVPTIRVFWEVIPCNLVFVYENILIFTVVKTYDRINFLMIISESTFLLWESPINLDTHWHLTMGYGIKTSDWTSCIHTAQCSDLQQ